MPRNSLKSVKPFDEARAASERTNPDYLEKRTAQMAREILSLTAKDRTIYYEGLELEDRNALSDLFENLRAFRPITELLEESRRCLEKAEAPHGSVAVTGKALDLLIKSFFPNLKGTLGKMLHALKNQKFSDKKLSRIVDELIKNIAFLEFRNAGAHFNSSKPDISIKEATKFLEQVQSLVKYEEEQAKMIFLHLRKD